VILRAAIASRGVWELRLDATDVQDRAYLRAHDDDLRHRDVAVAVKRDLVTPRSWHGSPDVRPRVAPAFVAAPATLPWARVSTAKIIPESLRRFQAALRSSTGDPRIVASGQWDGYFSEVLRENGAPTAVIAPALPLGQLSQVQISTAFWNAHMIVPHDTAEPWGAGPPSEADLYELTRTLQEGVPTAASCQMPATALKIEIPVHFRGLGTLDGANVRVTLLRWIDPATPPTAIASDATTWFSGSVGWTAAVNEVLNSEGANGGKTSLTVDSGWAFVLGDATESHRITLAGQTIDPTHAGIASFDFDASSLAVGTVVLLVAIIRAGTTPADDIALSAADVRTLVLNNPGVAARSIEITV
jgi:hypothetical protein